MKIECYLSLDCPTEEALRGNIGEALAIDEIRADVTFRRIDEQDALALGVTGSPSIFIDGRELQPQGLVGLS